MKYYKSLGIVVRIDDNSTLEEAREALQDLTIDPIILSEVTEITEEEFLKHIGDFVSSLDDMEEEFIRTELGDIIEFEVKEVPIAEDFGVVYTEQLIIKGQFDIRKHIRFMMSAKYKNVDDYGIGSLTAVWQSEQVDVLFKFAPKNLPSIDDEPYYRVTFKET